MLATINTDASVKDGYAGYAFWIVCDAGKIQKAGKIKKKVNGSSDAEAMCITNAIHTLKNSRFNEVTRVIVNTDSQASIDLLTGKTTGSATSQIRIAVDECRMLMMEFCLQTGKTIRDVDKVFQFRHVKAHSKKKDARSFVNEWCDKEAKKYCLLRKRQA